MSHDEDLIRKAKAVTQTIAESFSDLEVNSAEPQDPKPLAPHELGALVVVQQLLDLRDEEEVRRFLRCLEGISKESGASRLTLMSSMVGGEICVTNTWIEGDHLEVRVYIPAELETPDQPRRYRRPL